MTLNTVQFNLSRSFGPVVGGAILMAWGPAWAFFLTFAAIACVVGALFLIRAESPPVAAARKNRGILRQFTEAVSYTRGQPGIVPALAVIAAVGVLGMPVFQHVIVYSQSVFPQGTAGLTMMHLGLGVGTILAVPVVSGFEHKISRAQLARWSLPLYGLSLAAFAFAPSAWAASAILVLVGACFLASISVGNNSIQLIVADRMRGRVLALNVMVYTGSVAAGAYLQGLLSDLVGERETVVGAGCALLLVSAASPARGRWNLGRLDDPQDISEGTPAERGTERDG